MKLNRREFLARSAAGAALMAVGSSQSALAAEKPLEIIDTHTHFYDPTRPQGVPWPPKNDPLLYRKVMPADYRAQKARPVTATVVVEASAWVEDNQFILDLAKQDKFIIGLSGNLKPGDPEFAANLKRFAADKKFRGIRVNGRVLADNLKNEVFVADLKRLADLDLEMDVNGPADALPAIVELAQKLPTLRVVINHLSNIRIDGQTVDAVWQKHMEACAKQKHVHAKVSGLVEGTGKKDGTASADAGFYKPQLDVMWNAFGPDKLIYGSNWPVSERFAPLHTVQKIVHDYFRAKGDGALRAVFGGNARKVYKV